MFVSFMPQRKTSYQFKKYGNQSRLKIGIIATFLSGSELLTIRVVCTTVMLVWKHVAELSCGARHLVAYGYLVI